ncbi:hypothetical protein NDU88_006384 [Pleurodeles waltl]|uniref:Uncharacterized protein n=1 Tax=Pleurodeles waltl TaxID=8319 RepID=A0AAV7SPD6_PLEWA|nr:hypothetical protein NDU88_006384 [Pleurodeles waltl]
MSVRLFDYNYVVQYLPGVKNTVADFLSRMPLPSKDTDEFQNTDEDGKEDMWVAIVEEGICKGIMRDEWNTEQNSDEVMKELSVMITKGTNASPFELMRGRPPMSKDNVGWLKDAKRVEWCPEEVKTNIEKAQDKYKKHYDDIHKCKEFNLCVGDVVRVKSNKHTIKGQKRRYVVSVAECSPFPNALRWDFCTCWLLLEAFENGGRETVTEADGATARLPSTMYLE